MVDSLPPPAAPGLHADAPMRARLPWILLCTPLLPRLALAAEIEIQPGDDFEAASNALQPGDVLIVHGGDYPLTERVGLTLIGTEAMPITIRAADGETPVLSRAGADQNIIDFDAAEYVTISGIEFVGGSAGLRFGPSRFVTLADNEIHGTADVALRANDGGMYEGFQILRNHIHDTDGTGEGMYLGCNENACQFFGALIEGNYIHHTNQDTVEQGDGIEIKEGSHDNIVRNNVIHDTNYPCLLTYSTVGNGGPNVLEGNVMWNCGDHGIQSAADAVIRNNIILGSAADGIAMQSHQSGAPSNLTIVHNTVLHPNNDAISLRGAIGSVVIANNAIYAQQASAIFVGGGDTSMVTIAGNVGMGGISGFDATLGAGDLATDFVGGSFAGAPPADLFPAAGGALVGAGDPAYAVTDDFNCLARPGEAPDVGAYGFDAEGNPGWTIAAGFKTCAGEGGGTDGGGDTTGAGDDGGTGGPVDDDGGGATSVDDGATGAASVTAGAGESGTGVATFGEDDDEGGGGGCGCTSTRGGGLGGLVVPLLGIVGLGARRRRDRLTAARR
jgi:MYXO-CTERM domain-containing protein